MSCFIRAEVRRPWHCLLFLICLVWELISTTQAAQLPALPNIFPDAIRAHVRFLADGLLQGRAPGTPGYDISARYVAAQLESMGLHPAGVAGNWFQPVAIRKAVLNPSRSSLTLLGSDGGATRLIDAQDYVLFPDSLRLNDEMSAEVVFVGFGVTAPGRQYDDYASVDVRGKVVVRLEGAPASFPSSERAYYSDGLVKDRNAVAHGAAGILTILLPEDAAKYKWDWLVPQLQAGEMHWLDGAGALFNTSSAIHCRALLNEHATQRLFSGASRSLTEIFAAARRSEPQALALRVRVHVAVSSTHTSLESANVIGVLEGSDPALRSQYVVYSAHVDHLGLCEPVKGDNVCHGAIDNATGVATILEIARAYARLARPPRRSILFLLVTGEEQGLLGSSYFVNQPTVPRRGLIANLNAECVPGAIVDTTDLVAYGAEHSTLEQDVAAAAKQLGYTMIPDPSPEESYFTRSDQYSFVLGGIPALVLGTGVRAANQSDNAVNIVGNWSATHYHTPLDSFEQPINYAGVARAAQLNFLIGYEIAQQPARPQWKAGDFFGAQFAAKG